MGESFVGTLVVALHSDVNVKLLKGAKNAFFKSLLYMCFNLNDFQTKVLVRPLIADLSGFIERYSNTVRLHDCFLSMK